jgi:DNA-binding YbaB/EbfC family protein
MRVKIRKQRQTESLLDIIFRRIVMKFPGGMDIQKMMKQAQKMQEQMAKEMDALRVDATAGGGIVKVEMTGTKELVSIKIDPEAASDIEMLQDLIVAAVNECGRKVDEAMQDKLGGALGGLKIPGLM